MIKSHYSALITRCACECKRDANSGGLKSKPLSVHTHTLTFHTRALSLHTLACTLPLTYYSPTLPLSPSLTHSRERTSSSTLNCGRLATQRLMSNKCNLFMASTLPLSPALSPSLAAHKMLQVFSTITISTHMCACEWVCCSAAVCVCKSLPTLSSSLSLALSLSRSLTVCKVLIFMDHLHMCANAKRV